MNHISQYPRIKLTLDEKIICVQRKHWISLTFQLLIHIVIILASIAILCTIIYIQYPRIAIVLMIDFILLFFSFLGIVGTFQVINWYYDFYIITNKRIVREHYFRLAGKYYEEVFMQEKIRSADRVSKNIIYDLLNIEDIVVHFSSFDRSEPFVFESPSDPKEIEKVIEEISAAQANRPIIL